ncbi:MAG: hypothetical protein J6B01_04890 [Ruminococcus sp.]|nr:hypothetical protein [Ruminococcus sp.]MBO5319128.1 hypothetical protein [Ruminococcus sp.]
MSKDKVKKFFEDHKKEIKYGCIAVGATVGAAVGLKTLLPGGVKMPYKVTLKSSNEEFIDMLEDMFNYRKGERFDGGKIGWGMTGGEIMNAVSELLAEDKDDIYEYSLLLERIKK